MTLQMRNPRADKATGAKEIQLSAANILPNAGDSVHQIRQAVHNAGIAYSGEIHVDGQLHREHIDGDKPNTKNLAYRFYPDSVPAGWFKDHKNDVIHKWRADTGKLTHQEIIAQQAKIAEAKRQREIEQHERHENAATKAAYLWDLAQPANNHPYLAKKKIQAHRARQIKNALIIPLYDASNRLVNVQFISPEGDKRFLSGGRKQGCFFFIGERTDRILISEGYATGASLHQETGLRAVVAFDAGNLLPVARNIREIAPGAEIIVCGDNDKSGVGQKAANEAAAAVNGKVLIPDITGMDWNDYLNAGGEHA